MAYRDDLAAARVSSAHRAGYAQVLALDGPGVDPTEESLDVGQALDHRVEIFAEFSVPHEILDRVKSAESQRGPGAAYSVPVIDRSGLTEGRAEPELELSLAWYRVSSADSRQSTYRKG